MTDLTDIDGVETTEELIELIRNEEGSNGPKLSKFLEMLQDTYEEDGVPLDSELYFRVESAPVDISTFLQIAVWYGIVWEREQNVSDTLE